MAEEDFLMNKEFCSSSLVPTGFSTSEVALSPVDWLFLLGRVGCGGPVHGSPGGYLPKRVLRTVL